VETLTADRENVQEMPAGTHRLVKVLRRMLGRVETTRGETPPHRVTWSLTVNIWPDELDGGYGAECLELPGCVSQGETEEEALANVMDAIEEMLASILRERREAAASQFDTRGHRRQVTVAISA
jgi:predicted RNase H-like HicB family nuclease